MNQRKTVTEIRTLPKEVFDLDAYLHREERQLVFVYLGAPSCGFCQDPEYTRLLKEAKARLSEKARALRMQMCTIGVSANGSVADGIAFLSETGVWNEIVVGSNWFNSAMIEHVWSDPEAGGGIPQVVVFERIVAHAPRRLSFPSKRYLVRLLGKPPLHRWLEADLPLGGDDT